tara:strand:- start:18617 stop:18781 length:165 start_codon:yes stop_codon:yes gene_type:complete
MQKIFNTFSVLSISIIGIYFYLSNSFRPNYMPITHIDCVEEEPFVFGDSFKQAF